MFLKKCFSLKPYRIILGPPKHVLHSVWSALGISIAIKTALKVALYDFFDGPLAPSNGQFIEKVNHYNTDKPCHQDNSFNDQILTNQSFVHTFLIFETKNPFLVHLIYAYSKPIHLQCVTDKPYHPDNLFNDTIMISLKSFACNFFII